MSQPPASPALRDWLLLIGGSTYKFTLTSFYLVALVAILKNHGYSLNQLSWIHLIGGIEAAKVLFAALMERRPAGRFGRFRGWLLAATLGLSAVFGLMACTDITQNFPLLLACCVLLSAMSAVYGCAMLGLSCIVLPHRERGFGGVIQTMAARGGKMIGGALVLWLYQEYGQTAAAGFMLAFTLLMLLQLLCYREPESPTAQGGLTALAARLVSFWRQPETGWRWLVLLFAVAAPYAFIAATFVPKLADLGFTPKQTGGILAVGIPVACLIVTPLSGWFSRNYPRRKLVFLLYALQLPLLASMTAIDTLARVRSWLPPHANHRPEPELHAAAAGDTGVGDGQIRPRHRRTRQQPAIFRGSARQLRGRFRRPAAGKGGRLCRCVLGGGGPGRIGGRAAVCVPRPV